MSAVKCMRRKLQLGSAGLNRRSNAMADSNEWRQATENV
jgi:hypothetical protein